MLSELESRLWDLLKLHPEGISEYELLRVLQQELEGEFSNHLFRNELDMYRAHFLLFHALYRLSDYLSDARLARLDIHVLNIRLLPYEVATHGNLSQPDPMRVYYLNLENLEDTTLQDVKDLLGQFWERYIVNEKQGQALQLLGLSPSSSKNRIEQRYRQLAMQHHPDRGGDAQQFQDLQQAISVLRRHYRTS